MLVFQRARPGMGHFPYLGQAPAPAGPGPARALAERNQSPASSYSVSFKVRDSGKAYPGMLAFRPDDSSLYAISARVAPSDMMMLYAVEGPGTGTWKTVSVDEFRNNYRVVDEDEGIAIRNLAPATRPVGDLSNLDPVYPITLLSSAAITIADSFPTPSGIDPAKVDEYYQTGLSGTGFAILLVNEALDVTGSAYDALRIGKNALNLSRSVALEMAGYLTKIFSELQKGAGNPSEAVQNATKVADAFMAKVPYWSLLLERASLWVQSTDLNKMTRYLSDVHAFDGMLLLALNAINQKSDELIKNGMTPGELVEAKAYIEKILKNSVDADLDAQQRVQSYLDRNKMTKKDLERLALLTDKFFDDNAEDIAGALRGRSGGSEVSGLGSFFMGAFGQTPKPVLADQLDIARAGRASVRAGYQSGGVDLSKGRPYIENTLAQLRNLATRMGYDIRAAVRTLGGKVVEQKPEDVITSLQAQKDLLESQKAKASVAELNAIKTKIADIEKALKIAETNSALLDPKSIERFNTAISKLVKLKDKVGTNPSPEMLAKLAEGYVSVVLGPEGRDLAIDLRDPKNRTEFLSFVRDLGDALNLPENGLNTIVYGMVRRSLPGVEFSKGPVTESVAQAIVESLYNEAKTNIGALEAKIASIYDPKMPSYISTANEADLVKALSAGTGPFAGSTPVQLAEAREVVDSYIKTRRLMRALEARAMWPNGVVEEIGKMLNTEFSIIMRSDEWKNEAKKLAEDVKLTRSNLRKALKAYSDAVSTNPDKPPGQTIVNDLTDAQVKYDNAFKVLKEKVGERKEYAGVYRLLRALEIYNSEVMERAQRAHQAVQTATTNPDPVTVAAVKELVAASDAEVPAAAIVGDNIIEFMDGTRMTVGPVKEVVEKAAEETKNAEKADTTNALVSSANSDVSLTPIPEGSARPTLEELAPDRPEDFLPKAKGTRLRNTLLGLTGLSFILGALGGAALLFLDGGKKDPKSHDPIVPPPSDTDDLLKIGGVAGAIALLVYFLKRRNEPASKPEPEKKKPVVRRR